jgi:hypothetical protein
MSSERPLYSVDIQLWDEAYEDFFTVIEEPDAEIDYDA